MIKDWDTNIYCNCCAVNCINPLFKDIINLAWIDETVNG